MRCANLGQLGGHVGTAGIAQQGFTQDPDGRTISALGGHEVADTDHMVTETLIRGMVAYWRRVMEV